MSAAQSLFPYGLCTCYGRLSPMSGRALVCEQCGEITTAPDERTEADCDLFEIEQVKLTARELEPMPWGGRARDDWDALDDKSDLLPWTKTTRY